MKKTLLLLSLVFIISCSEEKIVYVEKDADMFDYTILGKWHVEADLVEFTSDGNYKIISYAGSDTLTLFLNNDKDPEFEYQVLYLKSAKYNTTQPFIFIEDLTFPYINVVIESRNVPEPDFTYFNRTFTYSNSLFNFKLQVDEDNNMKLNYNVLQVFFNNSNVIIKGKGTRIK